MVVSHCMATFFVLNLCLFLTSGVVADDANLGTHGYAESGDGTIHYVTKGEGPLVVMIHGFPDYW